MWMRIEDDDDDDYHIDYDAFSSVEKSHLKMLIDSQ